jgi:hypothetical protein
MDVDRRGFRVALVADEFVNPPTNGFDALEVLYAESWGVVQLPPRWYPIDVASQLLEQIAEHVEEFARHGYQIVLVGERLGLEDALSAVGVERPEAIQPTSSAELRVFLQARPPTDPALVRGESNRQDPG